MSKSKNNTIEPDGLIEQGYGADAIRLMELFIGPWNQSANWNVEGIGGTFRFLQRVWTLSNEWMESKASANQQVSLTTLLRVAHGAIKRVTTDLEELGFNTAIAALMEYVNELYRLKAEHGFGAASDWKFAIENLVRLLAPFAPHLTEELWHQLGYDVSVHVSDWPEWDENLLAEDLITIVVQVNGKVRDQLVLPADSDEAGIIAEAKTRPKVVAHLNGKDPKKTIYVPHKLVNFVS